MKRLFFPIIAILAGILLSIFLMEGFLRVMNLDYGNAPLESDSILHHRHPRNYTFLVHTPNEEYGGHHVHYDSEGLVSGTHISGEKISKPKYKIAVMGDSFVEATQVLYEKSFTGIIEQFCAGTCEVKNFGVSSYSPILYLLQWNTIVKFFKPTHVFLLLFSNDVRNDNEYQSKAILLNHEIVAVPGPGNKEWQRLLRKSYFLRLFRKVELKLTWIIQNRNMQNVVKSGDYLEESPEIEPFTEKMLLYLVQEIKQSNAKFILMAVPSKYKTIHKDSHDLKSEFSETIKLWAEKHGINFLDLVPAFQESKEPLFFEKDIHFNENGHRIIFETIKESFPELFSPDLKKLADIEG